MNPCEITASVTALANLMAKELCDDDLALIASVSMQLGDTLATIITAREICVKRKQITDKR